MASFVSLICIFLSVIILSTIYAIEIIITMALISRRRSLDAKIYCIEIYGNKNP